MPRPITLKLTDNQSRWLDNAARFLENETGCEVSPESLILHLVEHGLPRFEEELNTLRAKAEGQKRFAVLQFAQ